MTIFNHISYLSGLFYMQSFKTDLFRSGKVTHGQVCIFKSFIKHLSWYVWFCIYAQKTAPWIVEWKGLSNSSACLMKPFSIREWAHIYKCLLFFFFNWCYSLSPAVRTWLLRKRVKENITDVSLLLTCKKLKVSQVCGVTFIISHWHNLDHHTRRPSSSKVGHLFYTVSILEEKAVHKALSDLVQMYLIPVYVGQAELKIDLWGPDLNRLHWGGFA